ncbi:MAG TPA: hypothetical protein VFE50_03810 [Cyclobacteriaceae bacterium]|nr:hypothetical protein [Cyclobacteriaceae bacterium]
MRRITPTLLILLCPVLALAQENFGFPFGKTTYSEIDVKNYTKDTSAAAYYIKELAEAHVDDATNSLIIFTYHAKIKILKQSAVDLADIRVKLGKSIDGSAKEEIHRVRASAFNIVNNSLKETKMDPKSVFLEKNDKGMYDYAKFAVPDVKAGTVIEYQYEIISPFLYNFRKWEFQAEIPKMYSEYWTLIPGNYVYNIILRGYLPLTEKKDEVVRSCVTSGNGASANCQSTRYIMKDIPAFKEEEFMTAKENYISSINYELSELRHWDGRVDKVTKEWKDADEELKLHDKFGQQLRKGKDVVDGYVDASILSEPDQLTKAKKIYDFIKFRFTWNDIYGKYSDLGIKKAFDQKIGNVADINLSLIAALRYAGLQTEPVLIATRDVERPTELHPVLSDFNYVIAKVVIGDKTYLLDAVDDFLPFGLISDFCYNGKGRAIAEQGSYWMDIKPTDKNRLVTQVNMKLDAEGTLKGTITYSHYGYASVSRRKKLMSFPDEKAFLEDLNSNNHEYSIEGYKRTMEDDLSRPIVEVFDVQLSAFDTPASTHFLFNPFFGQQTKTNPFKTVERNFPVDYGVPLDRSVLVSIEYPSNVEVTSLPDKVGMTLPAAGGRYIYAAQSDGTKLSISNLFSISKPLFAPEEYPYLRELYAKMIQAENADIIFQRKK